MTPHFGDILLERRRQMGVSLSQVANAIKIRPQIIEYFETENFAAMPPRGYAQGIISSYARYLGLDSRMIVDAYFKALHEYEHSSQGARAGRFQDAAADALPRSSNASGRYYMVNNVPSSRFAHRPQQAGYVSEGSSLHEPVPSSNLRTAAMADGRSRGGYDASLRSRTRSRTEDVRGRGPARGSAAPAGRGPARDGRSAGDQRRRVPSGSPRRGRGPYGDSNVRGRPGQGGGGTRQQASMSQLILDPKFLLILVAVLLGLVLVLGFLALRGCSSNGGSPEPSKPEVSQADKDGNEDSDNADPSDDIADEDYSDDSDKKDEGKQPERTVVVVKVKEKGAVAWLEVKLDGKSVIGKEVVGPFKQEFTVEQQIDITTNKPADVSITKNGEKVSYDTRVSGVAKVSIIAPKKDDADKKVVDSDGDGVADMTAKEAQEAGLPVPDTTTEDTGSAEPVAAQ